MARLATNVHLRDARGVVHLFGPDDEVPEWAAQLITNPAAWDEPPALAEPESEPESEPEPAPPAEPETKPRRATRRKAGANASPVQPE